MDILFEFSEISDRQSTWLHLIASRAAFLALSSEFLMAKLISSISERKVTTSVSKDLLALDMLWFWPMESCKIKSEIISSHFSFFVFGHFWWRSYKNTKILCNLCVHLARQDGQDGKQRKKLTKIPKTKRWKYGMNEILNANL